MGNFKSIDDDLKQALRNKDTIRLNTIRSIKATVHNKEVELRRSLEESEFLQVVNYLAKQRRESIEQFEKGGRQDLVGSEKSELEILLSYLPPPLSEEDLTKIVDEAIKETGASSPKDIGKVMKVVMPKVAGGADGKVINSLVIKRLQP